MFQAKNQYLLFLWIFFSSLVSLALDSDDVVLASTPLDFARQYQIINGDFKSRLTLESKLDFYVQRMDGLTRAYQTKDSTTAWSVASQNCPQNKSLKCVSSYKKDDATFTLFRLNPNDSSQSMVIQCSSQFKENFFRDQAELKSCLQFSQKSCDSWSAFIKTVESYYKTTSKEEAKQQSVAELARQMAQQAKSINNKIFELFQADLPSLKKDLDLTLEQATAKKYLPTIPTQTNIESEKLNTIAQAYNEIFRINKSCDSYQKLFQRTIELSQKNQAENGSQSIKKTTPAPARSGETRQ